ncbi:hypothetical protein CISG_07521 [Coccidioides immitis RMSCC 3703]|uniref:Uncharacterized protein n=1 Tax=Coccidioides immitis RMSCC 3703 TaxID=454286 RepID=A0A0J8R623_COCIT|nr:hypothetical protein CISG_07521 [Coccidioides immitis RMSCC 3703]
MAAKRNPKILELPQVARKKGDTSKTRRLENLEPVANETRKKGKKEQRGAIKKKQSEKGGVLLSDQKRVPERGETYPKSGEKLLRVPKNVSGRERGVLHPRARLNSVSAIPRSQSQARPMKLVKKKGAGFVLSRPNRRRGI